MPGSALRIAAVPPLARDARVLAVRLSALGDVVFAMPAVLALRSLVPVGRLDWLTEDRHAELLRGFPGVDEVLAFPRRAWGGRGGLTAMWRHFGELRRRRYDAILDFQGNLKSALQLLALRCPRKIGFDRAGSREGAWRLLHERRPDPGRVHRCERDLALVRPLGFDGATPWPGAWPLGGAGATAPRAERAPVLLHTTVTPYGRDKAWPAARWSELARRLEGDGQPVRFLWTDAQRAEVEAVAAAAGCGALAPATPDLRALMAASDAAAAVVGTDSGPIHLAALRGAKVVALFGPTDPLRYAPPGPRARVVSALAPGAEPPPRRRDRRSPLMDALEVDTVYAGVAALLAER